jgi:hypothetical protein
MQYLPLSWFDSIAARMALMIGQFGMRETIPGVFRSTYEPWHNGGTVGAVTEGNPSEKLEGVRLQPIDFVTIGSHRRP